MSYEAKIKIKQDSLAVFTILSTSIVSALVSENRKRDQSLAHARPIDRFAFPIIFSIANRAVLGTSVLRIVLYSHKAEIRLIQLWTRFERTKCTR
jgi:hypothetical protein